MEAYNWSIGSILRENSLRIHNPLYNSQKKKRTSNYSEFRQSKINLSIEFDPNKTQEIGSYFTSFNNSKDDIDKNSIINPASKLNHESKVKNEKKIDKILPIQITSQLDKFQPDSNKNVIEFSY